MFFFQSSSVYVGLEVLTSSIRIAHIQKKGKKWKILNLQEIPRSSALVDALPKEGIIAGALPGREVLLRPLEIPVKKDKDMAAAVEFQIEPLLPYPLDKCILQSVNIEKNALGSQLTILSAKKDHLRNYLTELKDLSIDPDVVTSIPSALSAFAQLLPESEDPLILMYLGEKEGTCVLVEKEKPLMSRSFTLEKNDIRKTVLSMTASQKNKKLGSLILFCKDDDIAEMIQEVTGQIVVYPSAPGLNISPEDLQTYGFCIGVALAAAGKQPSNFRQKEFSFSKPWKTFKKPLIAYFTLGTFLSLSLFGMEKWILRHEEKQIHASFASLLTEEGIAGTAPIQRNEMYAKLSEIQKHIHNKPDTFPLLPLVPKVSDLLAWLSTHPLITSENGAAPVELESIHYTMVKRPEFTKRNEHYLVKVELEFLADNPALARAFHEALLAPNPFVNPKLEVQWTPSKGKYRTSFYLKDKTRYPL